MNTQVQPTVTFDTTLAGSDGKVGIVVPDEAIAGLGAGRRPAVHVDLNGHQYRSTVAVMGGQYLIGVNATVRQATGLAGGDRASVTLTVATTPREVGVPDDLATALAADAQLQSFFAALSNSLQRYHVDQVVSAKTPETRQRRIERPSSSSGRARSGSPPPGAGCGARPARPLAALRARTGRSAPLVGGVGTGQARGHDPVRHGPGDCGASSVPAAGGPREPRRRRQAALDELSRERSWVPLDEADALVTVGGDGTLLHALHLLASSGRQLPVFGLHRGTTGFLLNGWHSDEDLDSRLANARAECVVPLRLTATGPDGRLRPPVLAYNEVALRRTSVAERSTAAAGGRGRPAAAAGR
jgi:hypothetical protein